MWDEGAYSFGAGFVESAYEACLDYELKKAGLNVSKQIPLPLVYQDVQLECVYRLDLIVENKVIVEIKSVESLNPIHAVQLLTYLKLANCKLGLLMNFNYYAVSPPLNSVLGISGGIQGG